MLCYVGKVVWPVIRWAFADGRSMVLMYLYENIRCFNKCVPGEIKGSDLEFLAGFDFSLRWYQIL